MPKREPNILYSANSRLAFRIAAEYYNDIHYVWCATAFGSPNIDSPMLANPRTSNPYERYCELLKDTDNSPDRHSGIITSQSAGIKKGATAKHKSGDITRRERDEIFDVVDQAETQDFKPLMYIIPFEKVRRMVRRVPVAARAHPLADEWIIEKLPRSLFDIINF